MADLPPVELLAQAIKIVRGSRSSTIAATTLLYYDWLILLDQEVELIHKTKWSLIRVMYILTRYYPLLGWSVIVYSSLFDHDTDTCHAMMRPAHILQFPFQCLAQFVMVYRAYVFTGRKPTILMLLGSCYLAMVGIEFWSFLIPPAKVPDEFFELVGGTGCFADYSHPSMQLRLALMMSAAVVMDFISLLVVLFRVRRMMLRSNTIQGIFVQEGLLSFSGILVINAISAIVYFAFTPHIAGGIPYMFLMSNMFACRTILHLRNAGKRTEVDFSMTNPVVRAAIARVDDNARLTPRDSWPVYVARSK